MSFTSQAQPARYINPTATEIFSFGGVPVPQVTGCISYWNAAFNPIIYKIQRQDFTVVSIAQNSAGTMTLNIDISSGYSYNFSNVQNGDSLYMNCGSYVGVYTIVSGSGNNITVSISGNFAGSASGYVNLYAAENYRLQVVIGTFENNIFSPISTTIFTPDSTGLATINPMKWLQSVLFCKNDFDYDAINQYDKNLSRPYRIGIAEVHSLQPFAGTYSYYPTYNVTNSAKQLRDTLGQNMGLYVPIMNPQLISNNNFISGTNNWSLGGSGGATVSFATSTLTITSTTDAEEILTYTPSLITAAQEYLLIYKIKITGTATVQSNIGGTAGTLQNTSGIYAEEVTAASTASLYLDVNMTGAATVEIDYLNLYVTTPIPEQYCALFLSEFEQPTYWAAYPFDLQFIYSEYIAPFEIIKVEETDDINSNVIAHNEYNLDVTQAYYINHLMLSGAYDRQIKTVDVWLEVGVGAATNCYVNDGYVDEGYIDCMPPEDLSNLQIIQQTISILPGAIVRH